MDIMTTLYISLGVLSVFTLIIVLIIIAGRDIYFAFARRFIRRGADIFVANGNRHVDRYYKVPKDGVFKIRGVPYLTNPYKTIGISDEMAKEVRQSMDLRMRRLKRLITRFEEKKDQVQKQIKTMDEVKENAANVEMLRSQYADLDGKIEMLRGKLTSRKQSYFMARRAAYFYIENDPIPKDFYEYYTELDSIQLDNIIARVQTKDPKNIAKIEQTLSWIKKFLIFALIAAAVAAYFAFMSKSGIDQIAQQAGVTLQL